MNPIGQAFPVINMHLVVTSIASIKKDSAIPFPRRPWSRILCTNDLIVLHPFGIFIFIF